jgi:tetratricopeptide (TPR) repeat protein
LFYILAALFFVDSLLAKPVAVVLPITLLLIDYFEKRSWNYYLLIEKIPLLAISVAFGFKSLQDQHKFGSLDTLNVDYNMLERIGLGGYALVTYLWKAVVPIGLANYYPYPDKVNGSLPVYIYIYPLVIASALVFLFLMIFKKASVVPEFDSIRLNPWDRLTSGNRVLGFGSLFFLVNIALLLQFIPVGGAIIADRYSYIPYLGLFFMAGWFVASFFEPGGNRPAGNMLLIATVAYSLILGYLSNERCKVWYDTTSLWTDEIKKEPERAPNAYNNLGFNYFNKYNESVNPADRKRFYDSSYALLSKAIQLQPTFVNPYISLGELLRTSGDFPRAKANYYKALTLKSFDEDANAYLGLAIIYAISHNFDSSKTCFQEALRLKPYFPEAVSNYGNLLDMTGQHDSALVWYGVAVSQNPDMYAPYLNRGRALQRMHRCEEAMRDFAKALLLSPDNGEVYYARSFCYAQKDNKPLALQDIQKAISLGFSQVDKNYFQAMGGR